MQTFFNDNICPFCEDMTQMYYKPLVLSHSLLKKKKKTLQSTILHSQN